MFQEKWVAWFTLALAFIAAKPVVAQGRAAWTVLVYVMGDNNLEEFAVQDLDEMRRAGVGGSSGVNVIALMDRSSKYSSEAASNLGDWVGVKEVRVENGQYTQIGSADFPVGENPQKDLAQTKYLTEFIERNVKAYPAEKYFLILWDHGLGWLGFGGDLSPGNREVYSGGGVVEEPTITLEQLQKGIKDGLERAGLAKVDILGFDACFMQHYTVAANMEMYAEYILASEDLEPGHGWMYNALSAAVQDNSISAPALTKKIEEEFSTSPELPLTLATLSTSKFRIFMGVFSSFLEEVKIQLDSISSAGQGSTEAVGIYSALNSARNHRTMQAMTQWMDGSVIDLGTWLSKVKGSVSDYNSISSKVELTHSAYKDMIVSHTKPASQPRNTGMAIFYPTTQTAYDKQNSDWQQLSPSFSSLSNIKAWQDFLGAYYQANPGYPAMPPVTADSFKFLQTSTPVYSYTVQGTWVGDVYGEDWPGYYMMNGTVNSPYLGESTFEFGYEGMQKTYLVSSSVSWVDEEGEDPTHTTLMGESEGLVTGLVSYDMGSSYDASAFDASSALPDGVSFSPVFSKVHYTFVNADHDDLPDQEFLTYEASVHYYKDASSAEATVCELVLFVNLTAGEYGVEDSNTAGCTSSGCPASWQGDDFCDLDCMTDACNDDGGDCASCIDSGCIKDGACTESCSDDTCWICSNGSYGSDAYGDDGTNDGYDYGNGMYDDSEYSGVGGPRKLLQEKAAGAKAIERAAAQKLTWKKNKDAVMAEKKGAEAAKRPVRTPRKQTAMKAMDEAHSQGRERAAKLKEQAKAFTKQAKKPMEKEMKRSEKHQVTRDGSKPRQALIHDPKPVPHRPAPSGDAKPESQQAAKQKARRRMQEGEGGDEVMTLYCNFGSGLGEVPMGTHAGSTIRGTMHSVSSEGSIEEQDLSLASPMKWDGTVHVKFVEFHLKDSDGIKGLLGISSKVTDDVVMGLMRATDSLGLTATALSSGITQAMPGDESWDYDYGDYGGSSDLSYDEMCEWYATLSDGEKESYFGEDEIHEDEAMQCAEDCPTIYLGDGVCDPGCMNENCGMDLGDCDACLQTACTMEMLFNGYYGDACEDACATVECGHDYYCTAEDSDVDFEPPENDSACTAAGCPAGWQGDDWCDPACYVLQCNNDNGDCDACLASGCTIELLANEVCDEACNTEACQFDGSMCTSGDYADYSGESFESIEEYCNMLSTTRAPTAFADLSPLQRWRSAKSAPQETTPGGNPDPVVPTSTTAAPTPVSLPSPTPATSPTTTAAPTTPATTDTSESSTNGSAPGIWSTVGVTTSIAVSGILIIVSMLGQII
ncbi:hypothetical protein CYMTET_54301 [Cymbomonas tetramitiformis]|uniref:LNR domain-containing protein n=1 Tax=Cymbomonas tetramitiformis TaxID=36881 RepID=A0AAE0BGZ6_9CHLO|nr:hypothetical protein CYMTET_54301 [Cymbomonas tetramitiformis]